MKKITVIILYLVLVLSLVGCSREQIPEHNIKTFSKNGAQIAITSWTRRGKNLGHGWSRRIYP